MSQIICILTPAKLIVVLKMKTLSGCIITRGKKEVPSVADSKTPGICAVNTDETLNFYSDRTNLKSAAVIISPAICTEETNVKPHISLHQHTRNPYKEQRDGKNLVPNITEPQKKR